MSKKRIVVCGGNGFLGPFSPCRPYTPHLLLKRPRDSYMQSRRRSRLGGDLHLPLRRTHLVIRHIISDSSAVVNFRILAESRFTETCNIQTTTQRCGCSRPFYGDTARGGLQRRTHGEGIDMGRAVESVQCDQRGQSKSAGEAGGRGIETAGEGRAVDL